MIRFGIPSLRRFSLVASVVVTTAASAFGQSTQWSPTRPSRQTVLTESNRSAGFSGNGGGASNAGYFSSGNSESAIRRAQFTGDWQSRSSAGSSSSTRAPAYTAQSNRRTTTATYGSRSAGGVRNTGGTRMVAAQYGIELKDGEQLVGQPEYTEGGRPAAGNADVLPVPDGVSSDPMNTTSPRMQGEVVRDGEMLHEGGVFSDGGVFHDDGYYQDGQIGCTDGIAGGCAGGNCGGGCAGGNCGGCVGCDRDDWADPFPCPECGVYGYHRIGCGRVAACIHNCLGPLIREWSVFAGAQGFKGPIDLGMNGNFGFHEGFNAAGPLIPFPRFGLGYQVGGNFTQSDLSGNVFGTNTREQHFMTAGLFHRAYRHRGLQWGVVYDWLTENYYTKATLSQIRAEISWLNGCGHEVGFLMTQGIKEDTIDQLPQFILRPADQYNLFYRYTTQSGGQGRIWGGFTGQSLAIFGADFRVPVSNRIDFNGGFNYIIPNDGQNALGQQDESFGLSMSIVWYFGRRKEGVHNTPFRPLFNVADNNSFMLDHF
jgi:hypothetical protein